MTDYPPAKAPLPGRLTPANFWARVVTGAVRPTGST